MSKSSRTYARLVLAFLMSSAAQSVFFLALPAEFSAQSVPQALVSPPAGQPETGPHGEKLVGMPKFHDPAPYDINEHTGYKQIFDGNSLNGWDADTSIWRVENGISENQIGRRDGSCVAHRQRNVLRRL